MGSCLRRDSATVWAGGDEDWVDISSQLQPCDDCNNSNKKKKKKAYNHLVEKQRLLGEIRSSASSTSSTSTNGDHVKIKITKKELEELVHGGNLQGLSSVEQLARLLTMNGPDEDQNFYEIDHQRPWRPVLQTIPEY